MQVEGGLLTLHFVSAELIRDVETWSKMDPYVRINWTENGQPKEYKTHTILEAGKNPNWGEQPDEKNSVSINVADFFG
jgi:hypothetical protein